jgi:hypothetical protein
MRALLAGAALALLAGCSAPAAPPALPPAEAVGGGGAGPEAAAPELPEADGVELGGSCTGPAGIPVSHPADWAAEENGFAPGCALFSAEPFEVVPSSDARTAAVALTVQDVPFAEVAAVLPDEMERSEAVVDGRRAVRTEHVAGPGLWPEGTRSTRWVVDLGSSVLVADAVGLPPFDHAADVEVLDAMVGALDLDAGA